VPDRPLFLAGTFNKIADYSQEPFGDLLYGFRAFLANAERLAVCGYGFGDKGDKGINSVIVNWLYGRRHRRLVVIHRHPEDLRNSARGAISNKWHSWAESGRLKLVEKWVEELAPGELESCLAGQG
jgi:hypothetical protein